MGSNANEERYAGKPYVWGGKTYLFAPIGLGYMERAMELSRKIESGSLSPDEIKQAMRTVIYRSLRRNYPDLTEEFINDEILDLSNIRELYYLAMEASGLKPMGKQEAESPQI